MFFLRIFHLEFAGNKFYWYIMFLSLENKSLLDPFQLVSIGCLNTVKYVTNLVRCKTSISLGSTCVEGVGLNLFLKSKLMFLSSY